MKHIFKYKTSTFFFLSHPLTASQQVRATSSLTNHGKETLLFGSFLPHLGFQITPTVLELNICPESLNVGTHTMARKEQF